MWTEGPIVLFVKLYSLKFMTSYVSSEGFFVFSKAFIVYPEVPLAVLVCLELMSPIG